MSHTRSFLAGQAQAVVAPPGDPPVLVPGSPAQYHDLNWDDNGLIETTLTGFPVPSVGDRIVVCWSTGADRSGHLISEPTPTITDDAGNQYDTHASKFRDIGFDHATISSSVITGIPTQITYNTNASGPMDTNAGRTAIFIYVFSPPGAVGATGGFGELSTTRDFFCTPGAVQMEQDSITLCCYGVYGQQGYLGSLDGITWNQDSTVNATYNWSLRRVSPLSAINLRPNHRVGSDTNYAGCLVDFY